MAPPATTPGFEAYEVEVVVDHFARKVESLCVWGSTLLAGLSDGSLLFFEEQQARPVSGGGGSSRGASASDGAATAKTTRPSPSWQVVRAEKGFGKRTISQMAVVERGPALLSLSDDGVHLHALPELAPRATAAHSARSAAFAWDEARGLLAVAVRKSVVSHAYDAAAASAAAASATSASPLPSSSSVPTTSLLSELTEYALPDPALAVAWTRAGRLLVGTRRAYFLIVPAPPQQVEVLPGQVMTIHPAVAPTLLFPAGATAPPRLVPLPPGGGGGGGDEILVQRDAVAYFVSGTDGKLSRKEPLAYAEPPVALVAAGLYAVALLPRGGADVRSTSRLGGPAAAQALRTLAGMAVAAPAPAPDGSVYVAAGAGEAGVRRLRPVPPQRQARLLAAAGDFQAALELCSLHAGGGGGADEGGEEGGGSELAAAGWRLLEDALRLRLGHHLFAAGDVEEALTQLSMCSDPSPLVMLRLFPALLTPRGRALLPDAAYGEPLPPLPPPAASASAASAGGAASGASSAAAAAVGVVIPYLLSHRTRLLAQIAAAAAADGRGSDVQGEGLSAAAPAGPGSGGGGVAADADAPDAPDSATGINRAAAASAAPPPLEEVARAVDTALLLAMLAQPDSGALLRLLQQPNYVEAEAGAEALTAAGRYAELVALCQCTGQHARGLALLRQLSQDAVSLPAPPAGAAADLAGLPGVWAAVRYLATMAPPDLAVAANAAPWVFAADPDAGLEAFAAMRPPPPAARVLPVLKACAPTWAAATYLEAALELGAASPREAHSELLLLYLEMALEEEEATRKAAGAGEGGAGNDLLLASSWPDEREAAAAAATMTAAAALPPPPTATTPIKLFPDDASQWAVAPFGLAGILASRGGGGAGGGGGGAGARRRGVARRAAAAAAKGGTLLARRGSVAVPRGGGDGGDGPSAPATPPAAAPLEQQHARRRDAGRRLRELVYSSVHVDPTYVLQQLPPGRLPAVRVLMLERLGRHAEALGLLVRGGAPPGGRAAPCAAGVAAAEAYCDRVYAAAARAAAAAAAGGALVPEMGVPPSAIYLQLVAAVVSGAGGVAPRRDADVWPALSRLLSRKLDHLDAQQALGALPADLPLAALLPLIGAALQHASELRRNLSVVRSLRRAENLTAREDAVRAKQRCVALTAERACCICHKRIGGSVLVAYPAGSLAHYLCHKRSGGGGGAGGESVGGVTTTTTTTTIGAASSAAGVGTAAGQGAPQLTLPPFDLPTPVS